VLDTGIDATHLDLATSYRGGISFVPDESTPMDFSRHGTHMAGIIAAAINEIGVVGIAPSASLYAVKVANRRGSGQWNWLIAGIAWCVENNINILHIGTTGSSAPTALEAICNAAWNRGLLLCAGAGHSGPGMGTVYSPAKYESVIAVSMIDRNNAIFPFSSRGPEVELCAPGVDILSTIPRGGYGTISGTSIACAHVSGAAALAWGAHRYVNK
jgi:subtilisin